MAKKDYGCGKFATQGSFNNLRDGSQDFTNTRIRSSRIATSFNNKGSGSQDFKGLKIQYDDKSISNKFKDAIRCGMAKLFNYDENGSQTFPDFTFLKYLQQTLANKMGGTDPNRETKIKKSKT